VPMVGTDPGRSLSAGRPEAGPGGRDGFCSCLRAVGPTANRRSPAKLIGHFSPGCGDGDARKGRFRRVVAFVPAAARTGRAGDAGAGGGRAYRGSRSGCRIVDSWKTGRFLPNKTSPIRWPLDLSRSRIHTGEGRCLWLAWVPAGAGMESETMSSCLRAVGPMSNR
jgi:hypothetical protein